MLVAALTPGVQQGLGGVTLTPGLRPTAVSCPRPYPLHDAGGGDGHPLTPASPPLSHLRGEGSWKEGVRLWLVV